MATQRMETDVRSHRAYGVKPEDNGKKFFKFGNLAIFSVSQIKKL